MAVATRAAGVDLEAVEGALRAAVLAAGAKALEALLHDVGVGRRETAVQCQCGTVMRSSGTRAKTMYTLLSEVSIVDFHAPSKAPVVHAVLSNLPANVVSFCPELTFIFCLLGHCGGGVAVFQRAVGALSGFQVAFSHFVMFSNTAVARVQW